MRAVNMFTTWVWYSVSLYPAYKKASHSWPGEDCCLHTHCMSSLGVNRSLTKSANKGKRTALLTFVLQIASPHSTAHVRNTSLEGIAPISSVKLFYQRFCLHLTRAHYIYHLLVFGNRVLDKESSKGKQGSFFVLFKLQTSVTSYVAPACNSSS